MWQTKNNSLYREFVFKDFKSAFDFMTEVAKAAETQQHHPRWINEWNKVEIWLKTHEKNNKITSRDITLSETIDVIYEKTQSDKPKKSDSFEKLKIYTDGGSRGNPGPSASGYVILNENGSIITKKGIYLGTATNNQAEYQALKFALEAVKKLNVKNLDIYMDSLLIVNQLKGNYKVKNADLLTIFSEVQKLIGSFAGVSFTHIPRELNKLADKEVNKALDKALTSY
jgi:ribonuclease HI